MSQKISWMAARRRRGFSSKDVASCGRTERRAVLTLMWRVVDVEGGMMGHAVTGARRVIGFIRSPPAKVHGRGKIKLN
jgi:hypothetical protein